MVTWNSSAVLRPSLYALLHLEPPPAELVVVDNASNDASLAIVEETAAKLPFAVRVIREDHNTGFAAGMNRAIEAATNPFVLLLNPDVRVTPAFVGHLHRVLAESPSDVYAVGPKLLRASGADLDATNVIDSTGIRMTRDGRHFDRGADEVDVGQYEASGEVFGLTGAAVMFRKTALEAEMVDGQVFDEDFFAYREDADLAWRMRGFGYRALYEPGAVAFHLRRVTPERRRTLPAAINMHSVKNRFLLRIHHADRGWLRAFGLRSLVRDALVIGACLTIERSSLPGLLWVWRNRSIHLGRRKDILARRRIPGRQLRSWFDRSRDR
jgi:GT2 family glycosyltransferase